MKARTKAILAAADDEELLSLDSGVCFAISPYGADLNYLWFTKWFKPMHEDMGIDGWCAFWLGDFTPYNLERRLTYIAMAAAVSETEE